MYTALIVKKLYELHMRYQFLRKNRIREKKSYLRKQSVYNKLIDVYE